MNKCLPLYSWLANVLVSPVHVAKVTTFTEEAATKKELLKVRVNRMFLKVQLILALKQMMNFANMIILKSSQTQLFLICSCISCCAYNTTSRGRILIDVSIRTQLKRRWQLFASLVSLKNIYSWCFFLKLSKLLQEIILPF